MWEATKRLFVNIGCVGYVKKATLVNFYTNMTWQKCRNVISTQDSVSQKISCAKSVFQNFLRFRDKSVKFKLKHSAWKSLQNVWKNSRNDTSMGFHEFFGKQFWKFYVKISCYKVFEKNSRNNNGTKFLSTFEKFAKWQYLRISRIFCRTKNVKSKSMALSFHEFSTTIPFFIFFEFGKN